MLLETATVSLGVCEDTPAGSKEARFDQKLTPLTKLD